MTLQIGHQLRPRSSRRRGETIIKWDTMRRINLGIWKNIGKIVILIFQITYYQAMHFVKRVKRISSRNLVEKHNDRTTRSKTTRKSEITFI